MLLAISRIICWHCKIHDANRSLTAKRSLKLSQYLRQALAVNEIRHQSSPPMNGAALVRLRQSVWSGEFGEGVSVDADLMRSQISALDVPDVPPSSALVIVLVETLSQRLGSVGAKPAWESIGIKGRTGEEFMKRSAKSVSWPIWKTLRDAALDD